MTSKGKLLTELVVLFDTETMAKKNEIFVCF